MYKEKGIESVQNELEKRFTTLDFWEQYLRNKDTSYGYYESIEFTVVCKPDLKNLKVFKNNILSKEKIFESDVMTGKNNGAKNSQGDLKTPLGVYQLVNKLNHLDPFYGPLAIVTNYPNSYDKVIHNRTGDGIWIHGVPTNNETRDPYTKGCIALENNNLLSLDRSIRYNNSILIIDNENNETNQTKYKEDIAVILSELYKWKDSWQSGNYESYINFYSDQFKRFDGTDFEAFKKYKKMIFDRNEKKEISFKDFNITPYPNLEGKKLYKVTYYQNYSTKSVKFNGTKELYLEVLNNSISILFEG